MPALGDSFLAALPAAAAARFDRAGLEAQLAAHVAAGRDAWPDIALEPAALAAHLAGLLDDDAGPEALAAIRAGDVHLALACARGDAAAIARFEAAYFGEIDAAASRCRAGADLAAEARARLRRVLFVGDGQRRPATAEFAGRGNLRAWVRVSATREVIHLVTRAKREVMLGGDDALLDAMSPATDPELGYIRDMYRGDFAAAFRAALDGITARQRSLLRYQLVDGLTIDDVGRLHGVHRATAARWIADAREAVFEKTRLELAGRLGIAPADVDTIIRLVRSRLDVSMERLVRSIE
jgi:RNA polymerase sigma-70 factor (ECF subfamily)